MPFAATWTQLEILILSEVSQKERQVPYDSTHIWNLKHGTNEPVYKTETDSQTWRTDVGFPRGRGEGGGWTGRLGFVDAN